MVSAEKRYRKELELHLKNKVATPSNFEEGVYRGLSAIPNAKYRPGISFCDGTSMRQKITSTSDRLG